MDLSNAWEQLMLLKETTRRTQVLHEAQVLQLRMWPRVFFSKSTNSEFAVDFEKKRIVFTVTVSRKADPKLGKGLATPAAATLLDECVKQLLGADWDVEVKVGSGKSFRSYDFPRSYEIPDDQHRQSPQPEAGRREPPHPA